MDRSRVLFCVIFVVFLNVTGAYDTYQRQQTVCAYSNSGLLVPVSCFGLGLSCETNKYIKILNAVCGARKYFDNSCIPNIYYNKCYLQTNCCQMMTGDERWRMADEHKNQLVQVCSGKKQCHFKAPVNNLINYYIHYCYILYGCTDEPITASTDVSSTSTTWKPNTFTTSVISVKSGIHGTKKRHVATHSTTVATAPGDSSSLPLSAVIVPIVLITIGMVLGIVFVRKKRQKRKKQEPDTKGAIDEHTTERASNQYETISTCTGQQSLSPKDCERNSNQIGTQIDNAIAETYSSPSCHTEAEFEETVRENYHEIDLNHTKTAAIIGGPKETPNDANEGRVETNDTETADHEYFILEAEDTYNEINPEDIVTEYDEEDSTSVTEYNRIQFSKKAFTVDPNYDKLGVGKNEGTYDYSSRRDNMVQLTEMVDYSHITANCNVRNDYDDQYSHLNTTDTKTSDVENDITYDH